MSVWLIQSLFPLAILERRNPSSDMTSPILYRQPYVALPRKEEVSLPDLIFMVLAETRRSLMQASGHVHT
jgi:hypothetical protein